MKHATLTILILALAAIACGIQTTMPTDPIPTAPPAASTPLLTTGATPEPPENPAGAVFEIPEYWQAAQPTARPIQKGRSNYQ